MRTPLFLLAGTVAAAFAASAMSHGDPSPEVAAYLSAFDRVEAALAAADGTRTPDNAMGGLAWGESYRLQGLLAGFAATGDVRHLDRLAGRSGGGLGVGGGASSGGRMSSAGGSCRAGDRRNIPGGGTTSGPSIRE